MRAPRVTVVMPVFDGARFLGAAIESVLAQRFSDFELIVYDDGSRDDSYAIARSYDDDRVRVYRSAKNSGDARARNAILEKARGSLIAPHDADDIMIEGRLGEHVRVLDRYPEIGFVYGPCFIARTDLSEPILLRPRRSLASYDRVRRSGIVVPLPYDVSHCAATFRRTLVRELGGYRPSFTPVPDVDLVVRAGAKVRAYYLDRPAAIFRRRVGSLSSDRVRRFPETSIAPLRGELQVAGRRVQVHTGSRSLATRLLRESLSSLRPARRGRPDLRLTVRDDPPRGGSWSTCGLNIEETLEIIFKGRSVRLELAPRSIAASFGASVAPDVVWDEGVLRPLAAALAPEGVILLRAACVERDGRAIILAGEERDTKAACLAFLSAGFRYVSDDRVLLSRAAAGARAEQLPKPIAFDRETARLFPKARARSRWDAERARHVLDPRVLFGRGVVAPPSIVRTLLYVRRGRASITSMRGADVIARVSADALVLDIGCAMNLLKGACAYQVTLPLAALRLLPRQVGHLLGEERTR